MHRRLLYGLLAILLLIVPLITACPAETTPTPTQTTPPPASPTPTPETHWWDEFGEPQYGGDIVFASARYSENFDPYNTGYSAHYYFLETLVIPDWDLDRAIWPFKTPFIPLEYYQGHVAESWEIPDLETMIVHIRPGIHFQNKPPVSGRELTADDLEWHYDRFLGTGSGFTEPSAMDYARIKVIEKCTATDKYTAVFKFTDPSVLNAELITAQDGYNSFEPREVIEQYGNMSDWRNAIGTGPWMVDEVITGSSMRFVKNPDYWGYDDRHPENKLPYADSLTVINIPDVSTRLAALRTGRVHFVDELNWQQASNLADSNPELQQAKLFFISSNGIGVRVDMEPFGDIRVRKAMQMAIDRDTIAKTYYGGIIDGTPCGGINPINVGWCKPYAEWPVELQEEYSYHPDRSRELLTEAGYPNGFPFTLVVDSQADLPVVEIVKAYFHDVGIEMAIQVEDPAAAMAIGASGNYEAMWGRNTGSTAQPSTIARMDYSKSSTNMCRVNDPEHDAKCEQLVASSDMEEVKRLSIELDYRVIEEHWGIRLFPINIFSVWHPDLKGYSGENMLRMGSPGGWPWARYWLAPE